MDPFTIGALVLVGGAVVTIAILFATGIFRISSGGTTPRQPRESVSLTVEPDFVCPKADCVMVVDFAVTTDSSPATSNLSVRTPAGNVVVLSNDLSGRVRVAGNDPFFADGPGQYTFTLVADGLRGGPITARDDAALIPPSGLLLPISSVVTYSATAPVFERQLAIDSFLLGEGDFGKGHRRFTFCEKMTALSEIRYGTGGAAGRSDVLGIRVTNIARNRVIASANLNPGDVLAISPAISMAEGAAIEMTMSADVGGPDAEANAFPVGSSVFWSVTAILDCV
jgi:hypothetical protein